MPHIPTDADVYEVFTQSGTSTALTHVGSLVSPRREAVWHLAKEAFGRRDDLTKLWVVRRTDMIVSSPDDRDRLAAKTRMPHRQPGFPTARRRDRGATPAAETVPQRRDDTRADGELALSHLWLALADDLFILGNRLGDRICDYIDIEEALAVGSIGQEAVAHAGTILALSGFDQPAIDAQFFDRTQEQWQVSRAIERLTDWPSAVACGLVIAAAVTVLAEQTIKAESSEQWLPAISTIREEQLVHLDHWRQWAKALAAFPETQAEFARVYAEVSEYASDLFGAPPQGNPTGTPADDAALAATLHTRLATLINDNAGPGSRLSDHPQPRTPGLGGTALAHALSQGRWVRDSYAAGVFS